MFLGVGLLVGNFFFFLGDINSRSHFLWLVSYFLRFSLTIHSSQLEGRFQELKKKKKKTDQEKVPRSQKVYSESGY